jgi:hypothetical protein
MFATAPLRQRQAPQGGVCMNHDDVIGSVFMSAISKKKSVQDAALRTCCPWGAVASMPSASRRGGKGKETRVADDRLRSAYKPYLAGSSTMSEVEKANEVDQKATKRISCWCKPLLHLMPLTSCVTPCTASPSCAMMLPTRRCTCIRRPSPHANSSSPPSHAPSSVSGTCAAMTR